VLLCSDDSAAAADWALSSAFWALLPSLEPGAQSSFNRAQDDFFKSLTKTCNLPTSIGPFKPSSAQVNCIVDEYHNRAASYRARLTSDALAEANLSPERHKQIQAALISLGRLNGTAEGVFGRQTRTAIKAFQSNNGFPQTGFLTSQQRQTLFQQTERSQVEKKLGEPVSRPEGSTSEPASAPVSDQPQPPLPSEADDLRSCSGAPTLEAVNACSRLITVKDVSPIKLKSYLLKRAVSQEALKNLDAAYSDFSSALSLDPSDQDAKAGKSRTESKYVGADHSSELQSVPQAKRPLIFGHVFIIITILLTVAILLTLLRVFWPGVLNAISQRTSRVARQAGAVCGLIVLVATVFYLRFGDSQNALAVSRPARYVPATAQAYIVVPHLGDFLDSTKKYLEGSSVAIDVGRVAKALNIAADDLNARLSLLKSALTATLRDENHTVPLTCLDLSNKEDRALTGLRPETSAAAFVGNQVDATPAFIIGPIDRERFASYLSNSTSQYLIDLQIPTNDQLGEEARLTIENWRSLDFKLCRFDETVKPVSSPYEIILNGKSKHAYLTLDPIGSLNENSSFELLCTYSRNGKKTPCHCEVLERSQDGKVNSLGNCTEIGKNPVKVFHKSDLRQAIEKGGSLPDSISFNLPLLGPIGPLGKLSVHWNGDTVALGTETALAPALTDSVAGISIIEDDSFVSLYKRVELDPSGFLAAIRPDYNSIQTFFSKIVTLPVVISGAVIPNELSLSA
jgi:peptidoglycan hydrolase-like protein with peptidoglycan-binding domain